MPLSRSSRARTQSLLPSVIPLSAKVGHAQNVAPDVVDYARTAAPPTANAIDLHLGGVLAGADLEDRQGRVLMGPAGVHVSLEVTPADTAEVLASTTATLEVGKH